MAFTAGSNYKASINRLELHNAVRKLTLLLYEHPMTPRTEVQRQVELISDFISESYVPFLQKELAEKLSDCASPDALGKINVILEQNKLPFRDFKTEHLRLNIYKRESFYFEPEDIEIGKHKQTGEILHASYISVKKTLKVFLELPGIYESIKNNMKDLESMNREGQPRVISNLIQAKLWKERYRKEGRNSIPCVISVDDLETGNAMGSHAGERTLAMTYLSIPVLPPHLVSKLTNIFLVMVFDTKNKKHCENSKIYGRLIEELKELSVDGITIKVNGVEEKVYFDCPIIAGDNKGLNEICGFSKSFNAKYYCRICRLESDRCRVLSKEVIEELRNMDTYKDDVRYKSGGVLEECIFNQLPNFHILYNLCLDIMHDILEGIAKDVLELILSRFILIEELFTVDDFNRKLESFDFGHETSNHPRPISTERCTPIDEKAYGLTNKIRVKQSASEMACLVRYLGCILDDLTPTNSEYWLLYVYFRKFFGIIMSPQHDEADFCEVQDAVEIFNTHFVTLYGRLKAKPHFITHIKRVMEQNGPPVHYMAMSFERKHRTYKNIAEGTSSSRDLPKTIAIKNQLLLSCRKEAFKQVSTDYEVGPVKNEDNNALLQIQKHVTIKKSHKFYKHVTIIGHKFTTDTIFVDGHDKRGYLSFSKLKDIIEVDNVLYFHVCSLQTKLFNDHYHAHQVFDNNIPDKLIPLDQIKRMPPCLLFKNVTGEFYAACRYD